MAKYAAITYLVESARADMENQKLPDSYYTIEGDRVDKATYESLGERQGKIKGAFESYLSNILAGDAKGISKEQADLISREEYVEPGENVFTPTPGLNLGGNPPGDDDELDQLYDNLPSTVRD